MEFVGNENMYRLKYDFPILKLFIQKQFSFTLILQTFLETLMYLSDVLECAFM